MAKMTLLAMVKNILAAIEADDVNSISDTPEGLMVAGVIEEVYYQMALWNTPDLEKIYFSLEGLGDTTLPNYLRIPSNIEHVYWFRYDSRIAASDPKLYKDLKYYEPEEFYEIVMNRDSTAANVVEVTGHNSVPMFIINDKSPEFYTVDNVNGYLICDSFDTDVDTTLQGSKTVAAGDSVPSFTIADTFTPQLDANLFPFLLAEAKAVCFVNYKQISNNKIEKQARNARIHWQNEKSKEKQDQRRRDNLRSGPNYGRK